MKKLVAIFIILTFFPFKIISYNINSESEDDWLYNARILTPYFYSLSWEEGVRKAVEKNANVILDWFGGSDTYQGRILSINESIRELEEKANFIHSNYPGIKYVVYIAPLEMQTIDSDMNRDGKDDDGKNSTYTDHPDWLQVGKEGSKAVFYGSMSGMPFWVDETSEDVWLSPSNKEYKNIIMNIAREMAKFVDGVWLDVPHLCFEFGYAWKEQWCSFDEASLNDFYSDTGFNLSLPIQPDWNNISWLSFIKWRYKQINDYIRDFNNALKEINRDCKLIVETSSSTVSSTQYGVDLKLLNEVCDAIAHEYSGPFKKIQYYGWLYMLANLKFWNDIDFKHSWLLSYVYENDIDLLNMHTWIILSSNYDNYYTSGDESMSGAIDENFIKEFFEWIGRNGEYFYGWENPAEIALVFSRNTLDYADKGGWEGYAYHDELIGSIMMLIQSNIQFKVIDEKDIKEIKRYKAVVLPDFSCMSEEQGEILRDYVKEGGILISTYETSLYNEFGKRRNNFLLQDLFGVNFSHIEEKIYLNEYGKGKSIFYPLPVGRYYIWEASPGEENGSQEAEKWRNKFLELIEKANIYQPFEILGNAIAFRYEKDGKEGIRILNFGDRAELKIRGKIKDAKILNFMEEVKDINFFEKENETIIEIESSYCSILYSIDEEPFIEILKPSKGKIYIADREIARVNSEKAIIIGKIRVNVITNGEKVDFYLNGKLEFSDNAPPYEWLLIKNCFGNYEIKAISYLNGRSREDNLSAFILQISF
ncbi:MAG: beta-galactosidase trimerization domain-containing protein [Candidatus Thermoplasmatota archaeon]